jgi:putative phage-type endonuclease
VIHHPESREDWLALRHKYVSSTEQAALHGLSPYLTAFELYHGKRAEKPTQFEQNERMTWGIRQEESVARGIAEDYGVKVRKLNAYVSLDGKGMGSSFDYEIVGVKDGDAPAGSVLQDAYRNLGPGILEIKCVDWLIHKQQWIEGDGKDQDDEAPPHIEIQVQHQLHTIQRKWAAMGVLIGGNKLQLIVREYDAAVGAAMEEKVREFWKNVKAGIAPPPVLPEDADMIAHIYNFGDPDKVIDAQGNAEIKALTDEYIAAGKSAKAADDAKTTAKAKLLMLIGDASKVVVGQGISITAGTVAEGVVEAYTRKACRQFRVNVSKVKEAK